MKKLLLMVSIGFAGIALCAAAGPADADATSVSVKLTTNALGLGTSGINYGKDGSSIHADIAGKLVTSTTTGLGSILYVQRSGLAGSGTTLDPLLCTITAYTRLDTVTGLPAVNDYQAGVITLTDENTSSPDGKDEGLGVRAFRVGSNALRTYDKSGLAIIEGSKEVSGGTGPSAWYSKDPNGPPHVDDEVLFSFAPDSYVLGQSIIVTLSKFEAGDKIDLNLSLIGGGVLTYSFAGTSNPAFSNPGDSVWNVSFAKLTGLGANDFVSSFSIRAIDDDPLHPSSTAEHFLITGFSAQLREPEVSPVVPELPTSSLALLASPLLAILRRRRR